MIAEITSSVLVLVDLQQKLMPVIYEHEEVVRRVAFIKECAEELGVPVLATTQNLAKLGPLAPEISHQVLTFDKMSFSCALCPEFMEALRATGAKQVILTGVETHICVMQTAIDLLDQGFKVTCAVDAISARSQASHKIALKRLTAHGVELSLTESVVYEWMRTADHPSFRPVVKKVIAAQA